MASRQGWLIGNRRAPGGATVFGTLAWQSDGFRPARCSPFTRRPTLLADRRGERLALSLPAGEWTLMLTRHPWSGTVLVRDAVRYETLDLYALQAESGITPVPVLSAGEQDPIILEATGLRGADSRGSQIWFLGVAAGPEAYHPEAGEPVSDTCRLIRAEHGTFLALRTDTGVADSLASSGVWEEESIATFRRHAAGARLALDIGANFGHHSVVLSRLLAPGGKLLSFEPQMQMFNLLNANLVLNGCSNVEPYRMGLGAAPAQMRMHPISYQSFNNFGALGVQPGGEAEQGAGEPVEIATLDGFLDQRGLDVATLDFIKMDVQSFELFVLRGATRTLELARPVVYLEVAPYWIARRGYDYREIYRLLSELGYSFHNDDLSPHPVPDWDGESKAEWNLLALPLGRG